jgi:hypothetical protein
LFINIAPHEDESSIYKTKLECSIFGIIGYLELWFGKYLFVITEREKALSLNQGTIWKITKAQCIIM